MGEEQTRVFNESFEEFVRQSFQEMNDRLAKLEPRAYDTKPIWENALAEIVEVKQDIAEVRKIVERTDRKVDVLSKDMITMRADIEGHEQRIERLENRR